MMRAALCLAALCIAPALADISSGVPLEKDPLGVASGLYAKPSYNSGSGSSWGHKSGDTSSTYSHTSAGGEIKNAAGMAAFGFILFILGFPVLWFNESREAVMWELFGKAARIAVTDLTADKVDASNDHYLVHVQGVTKVSKQLEDKDFKVRVDNCAALSKTVEMYQWVETSKSESKDDNMGGKDTKTTYTYTEGWSNTFQDSGTFNDQSYRNPRPSIELGNHTQRAQEVSFGAFKLSSMLAECIASFENCTSAGPEQCEVGGWPYSRQGGYYGTAKGSPSVGDIRVEFKKAPCGNATVLAVQTGNTFAPFAFDDEIEGGKVKLKGDKEQALLGGQKKKVGIQLDTSSHGGGCCAICSGIGSGFASGQSVCELEERHASAEVMLADATQKQELIHKICKFVGWVMIVFGLQYMFALIPTLFRIIPFVGTWIQYFGKMVTNVLAFCIGSMLSLITIALAWLRYRPVKAAILISIGILCFMLPTIWAKIMAPTGEN